VLLLAVGSLERRLGERQLPTLTMERVQADLRAARSTLQRVDMTPHHGAERDLSRDLLEARRLILDVTSVLLGAVMTA
jgi:hypothetical protein